jgi:hypothetical protein
MQLFDGRLFIGEIRACCEEKVFPLRHSSLIEGTKSLPNGFEDGYPENIRGVRRQDIPD